MAGQSSQLFINMFVQGSILACSAARLLQTKHQRPAKHGLRQHRTSLLCLKINPALLNCLPASALLFATTLLAGRLCAHL
jgi:hypothetical protein